MNLSCTVTPFVRDQRILQAAVIETDWLGGFLKQIDDGSAPQAKRILIHDQAFPRPLAQQNEYFHLASGFFRIQKIQERIGNAIAKRMALIKTEIKEEILVRKREILLQQHVSRM